MCGFPPSLNALVTLDNWLTFPHSMWSFQNARQLFRSKNLPPSKTPQELSFDSNYNLDDFVFANDTGAPTAWKSFLLDTHTDSCLVLYQGKVIFEYYARDMTPQTPHMLFSVTKSFIGLLAEILAAEKVLDVDKNILDYVPELSTSEFASSTVRQLLDMVDGVTFDETYSDPNADVYIYSRAYWGARENEPHVPGGVYSLLPNFCKRFAAPGEVFKYRTPVGDVVGWALQRASGQSLSELVSTRIWGPIGAVHEAYMIADTAGQEIAGTGINATTRDLARMALLLLNKGKRDGVQVMPEEAIESILEGGDRRLFAQSAQAATRSGWSYRSNWWVTHNKSQGVTAIGVFGQRFYLEPTTNFAVIKLGSQPSASNALVDRLHEVAFEALSNLVRNKD